MKRGNGKPEMEGVTLDPERELPSAEEAAREEAPLRQPQELEQAKLERDQLYERLARLQAEFENFRKRAQREQADFRQYAAADTLKALLPALDSFERALASNSEASDFRSGVELIYRQLRDVLTRLGVNEVEAEGRVFDPRVHEAIEMTPVTEGEDNRVLQVLQRGYMLKDRLLRPAMVRVARRS
ncbi:MAG: nucleotide exchange factor GrpE [Acidobacteria bacterium]|nr:nucleotide exchange factor GrpE [Acidobacteriota bacterium]